MGVNNLWPILSEISERKPLTYLAGKKVAVDLSGWVVEATTCQGLNRSKNPHLRNLFFRVSRLLQFGVYPIFVMEGEVPTLKGPAFKERNFSRCPKSSSTTDFSRNSFERTLKECKDILTCLGIPCIKSSGEGEALCAFLCMNGVVDGVITEDNDAFLYGADVVYRDFTIDASDSHVNVYCLKSEKNKLDLNRQNLVALALLLGCDYSKGVPGIGKETALKLLSELKSDDILQRFKDWKNLTESELFPGLENKTVKKTPHCNRCGHLGSKVKHNKDGCSACDSQITCYLPDAMKPCRCPWHIKEEIMTKRKTELKIYCTVKNYPDFPDLKVINEYLNYTDEIPSCESLEWNCPNLSRFQEKVLTCLGWTYEYSFEKMLPLITSWQQFKLQESTVDKTNFIYEPVKIVKERTIRDVDFFDVEWKLIGENDNISSDNIITQEYCDRFSVCYKETVEEFNRLKSELKEKKQPKNKFKKLKSDEANRKISEFFVKKSPISDEDLSKEDENITSLDPTDIGLTATSMFDAPPSKRHCT